jgi:hypothetical protein
VEFKGGRNGSHALNSIFNVVGPLKTEHCRSANNDMTWKH